MDDHKPYYPAEWQDNQVMDVLFSHFRQSRDINPKSWDKKMKFWRDMISLECVHSNSVVVNADEYSLRFKRKGKHPVCLKNVIEDMVRTKELTDLSTIQNQNQGWMSWSFGIMVKKPLSWTVTKLMGWNSQSSTPLINTALIKEKSKELLELHFSQCDSTQWSENTVEFDDLRQRARSSICGDDLTFDLVINELCMCGKATVITSNGSKLIRFTTLSNTVESPVAKTDVDVKLIKIKKTESLLNNEVEQICTEIERLHTLLCSYQQEARKCVREGKKAAAKKCLREKQLLTQRIEQKEKSLQTLSLLRQQIIDSESNKQVLDAYSAGTSAFKDMTSLYGLNMDNIDNVMSDIQEVSDTTADINATMSTPMDDADLDISAAELEAELDELLAASEDQPQKVPTGQSQTKHIDDLPDLPDIDDLTLGDLPEVPAFNPLTPPQKTFKRTTELSKLKEQLYSA